jgi:hypothetical protein
MLKWYNYNQSLDSWVLAFRAVKEKYKREFVGQIFLGKDMPGRYNLIRLFFMFISKKWKLNIFLTVLWALNP